jgi:hypothetical protein
MSITHRTSNPGGELRRPGTAPRRPRYHPERTVG